MAERPITAPMTDAEKVQVVLNRLVESEVRAAFAAAGAKGEVHRSVLHRVRSQVDDGGRLIVDATAPDGVGTISLSELVEEIKNEVPTIFETKPSAARERPKKTYSLPVWQRMVAAATPTDRSKLMRDHAAGKIEVVIK